jgi:hypothetical protein
LFPYLWYITAPSFTPSLWHIKVKNKVHTRFVNIFISSHSKVHMLTYRSLLLSWKSIALLTM